jgi:hypothetical protein
MSDSTENIRRDMIATGQPEADLAAAKDTCDWCGEELYESGGKLVALRREAGLICKTGPGGGAWPGHHAGGWATAELQADFEILGFAAPFAVVKRRSDGATGSLEFTHSPRVYFGWREDAG